jgi:acetyl esterase/lipase
LVRAHAKEWNIDPRRIGIMGFSAGAELAAPAAVLFEDFDKKNSGPGDPLAGITSRPDFAGIIYRLWRLGRPRSRRMGDGILQRDAGLKRAEH